MHLILIHANVLGMNTVPPAIKEDVQIRLPPACYTQPCHRSCESSAAHVLMMNVCCQALGASAEGSEAANHRVPISGIRGAGQPEILDLPTLFTGASPMYLDVTDIWKCNDSTLHVCELAIRSLHMLNVR